MVLDCAVVKTETYAKVCGLERGRNVALEGLLPVVDVVDVNRLFHERAFQ